MASAHHEIEREEDVIINNLSAFLPSHKNLKGQCHKIFASYFIMNHLPPSQWKYIWVNSNFFENSRRYSQGKVYHWFQRHRQQIMGTISDCWHHKVKLKEKNYLYVNSTTQRCPNKIIKTVLIEDCLHLTPVLLTPVLVTPVVHLELQISL